MTDPEEILTIALIDDTHRTDTPVGDAVRRIIAGLEGAGIRIADIGSSDDARSALTDPSRSGLHFHQLEPWRGYPREAQSNGCAHPRYPAAERGYPDLPDGRTRKRTRNEPYHRHDPGGQRVRLGDGRLAGIHRREDHGPQRNGTGTSCSRRSSGARENSRKTSNTRGTPPAMRGESRSGNLRPAGHSTSFSASRLFRSDLSDLGRRARFPSRPLGTDRRCREVSPQKYSVPTGHIS